MMAVVPIRCLLSGFRASVVESLLEKGELDTEWRTSQELSLTPRHQPGVRAHARRRNCFNRLSPGADKPLKQRIATPVPTDRVEAAVLMTGDRREISGLEDGELCAGVARATSPAGIRNAEVYLHPGHW